MERPGSALLYHRLPAHHLLLVGTTTRFRLRQPPDDALSRFWIL